MYHILCGDCILKLDQIIQKVHVTFLDLPFNQQKDYALHNDENRLLICL
jgi:DNA modification methylase